MKRCLLLLGIGGMLVVGAPAYSQYIFMDVNGDGVCTTSDILNDTITSVDVWLDTNHNKDGSTATCATAPATPLDMFGYDIIVHAAEAGSVSYSGWTNAMTLGGTWTPLDPFRTSGNDASIDVITSGSAVPAGKYKLGSFNITVSGSPVMSFLTDNVSLGGGSPVTGFGSDCSGQDFAFTVVLGTDFHDVCGTSNGTPTRATTWGTIKNLYR